MSELPLDDDQWDPFAGSTAWACRSWCGANRRLTPAVTAAFRNSARIPAGEQGRPRVGPRRTQKSAPTGSPARIASHGSSCSQDRGRDRRRRRPPAQIPACASTHWAPPSGFGVEALVGPGVQDAGLG